VVMAVGHEPDEAWLVVGDVHVDPVVEARHASVDSWDSGQSAAPTEAHHPRLDPAGGAVVHHHFVHHRPARISLTRVLSSFVEAGTNHVGCDCTVGAATLVVSHDGHVDFLKDLGRGQVNTTVYCPPAGHPAHGSVVEGAVHGGQTDGADVVGEHDRVVELQQDDVVVHLHVLVVPGMADDLHDRPVHLVGVRQLLGLATQVDGDVRVALIPWEAVGSGQHPLAVDEGPSTEVTVEIV